MGCEERESCGDVGAGAFVVMTVRSPVPLYCGYGCTIRINHPPEDPVRVLDQPVGRALVRGVAGAEVDGERARREGFLPRPSGDDAVAGHLFWVVILGVGLVGMYLYFMDGSLRVRACTHTHTYKYILTLAAMEAAETVL